jgi:hypothetical protein
MRATNPSGTPSNQVDRGGPLAARNHVAYWCVDDHTTKVVFEANAEVPLEWECATCGSPAQNVRGVATVAVRQRVFPRTPYEFLMMRRTPAEGEELLADALADVKRRRAAGEIR